MHDTAMQNGKRFFDTYIERLQSATVVDIGSQNVNGSLQEICSRNSKYIGVDFVVGKGVDVVLSDPYKLPFDSDSIDAVVSSSCFEHSEMFWVLFLEMIRILKPDGLLYLNAPSNGAYHRHPVDCWRFYPDCGTALAKWARLNRYQTTVLEAYTSNQLRDSWNDYVCIFLKDESRVKQHPHRILHSFADYTNGTVYPANEALLNPQTRPEDQRLNGWRLAKKARRFMESLKSAHRIEKK